MATPPRQGLYDPRYEHDACGVGFVANMRGERSHQIVEKGLEVLRNLTHRGACGCDPLTGDGAGLILQIPHDFFEKQLKSQRIALPAPGQYGVAMVFLPGDAHERDACERIFEKAIQNEGLHLIGWRAVPVDPMAPGEVARSIMPAVRQLFVGWGRVKGDQEELERKLYVVRKQAEFLIRTSTLRNAEMFHVPSCSTRTIVYKGMLLPEQIPAFYHDLTDSTLTSAIALVHQRFSTNTFPSWDRAHPYRFLAHNGEINTLRGNENWMHAREKMFASERFGDDVEKIRPVVDVQMSDSGKFDNTVELLVRSGRSLPHAIMMMVPEAWQKHESMSESKRAFYQYHSCLMEPWDGPASIAFTDGRMIGAVLDRNGLRPSRYVVTKDGFVVMASEVGVLDLPPDQIAQKNRLQPGKMFLVDMENGRIVDDEELKEGMAARKPYGKWLKENFVPLKSLPAPQGAVPGYDADTLLERQQVHGYTHEDIKLLMSPMALNGQEAVGSMGTDTPLAALSDKPQLLFSYFKQLFAQVTNPPIDPIREDLVMSVQAPLGAEQNLFDETPAHCHQLELENPVISNAELQKIKEVARGSIRSVTIPTLFRVKEGGDGLEKALEELCERASKAIEDGFSILVLSDRGHDAVNAPIPSLLATAAVHHHLIREGTRARCGLVVESGEPREVHHFCTLIGYGAGAINPYLALETLENMIEEHILKDISVADAVDHYLKAANKGILKVMTKMGISTVQSYRGAQIFEAVGLNHEVIDKYFTWTASRIEGVGLDVIARETGMRHHLAHEVSEILDGDLDPGGQYQWRRRGEFHMYNPDTIAKLQHACRSGNYRLFKEYSSLINAQDKQLCTIRGLLKFKPGTPIPLAEVEPASEIVKRFKTGAMSLGSISREAHENLAIAMNRIGGRSNTGEGGEDPVRYQRDPNGDSRRSSIKQVASGRFGVTSHYLVNADELQIKMAQGAKPGEGGQLPGHKIDEYIARIRCSTPGVGLISPPPHHDIYSIEDLAQLIHDLKNSNNRARISVKLVAEVGVGTVAAGVSKAKADLVLISGDSGGTGASPLTSIKYAGLPWELGLAETQQVLVLNDLRGRIRVETDGQLKTGRDVAVAALLGAEEFGFATSALVASGCILMRVCHLNTCPVGIATQDPRLRAKFAGKPEHVVNMMMFIAEELREIMAELGFRTVDEMVGHVEALDANDAIDHWKGKGINLAQVLHRPDVSPNVAIRCVSTQDHGLEGALDNRLIEMAKPALERREKVEIDLPIRNINRTACTMLSAEVSRRHGLEGLPPETISIRLHGSAGQSFGAFMAPGISVTLEGDANDYFGKGMSAGRMVVFPPKNASFVPEDNIIVGNVALYGATGGEIFLRGQGGERFAVRNSGATAVVEGVGDHGCEYMTKGVVVVLGRAGRNFAAGMSGGVAFVYDADGSFATRCNMGMVELDPMQPRDVQTLRTLIERHRQFTGSAVADRILANWDAEVKRFVMVMPVEYRNILKQQHLDPEAERLAAV